MTDTRTQGEKRTDQNAEALETEASLEWDGRKVLSIQLEEGDRILAINGIPTLDLEEYTEVLDTLIIGRTVTVRVRREEAEVDLQVEVGSRAAR